METINKDLQGCAALPSPATQLARNAHARPTLAVATCPPATPLYPPLQDRKLILHPFLPSTQAGNSGAAQGGENLLTRAASKINRKLPLPLAPVACENKTHPPIHIVCVHTPRVCMCVCICVCASVHISACAWHASVNMSVNGRARSVVPGAPAWSITAKNNEPSSKPKEMLLQ